MTRPTAEPPRSGTWRLHDARAQFSELVRRVRSIGPQHITVQDDETIVVISAEEFRRLSGDATGQLLVEALQASPHREIDIEPERAAMPVRNIDL
ncbi:type II toxin-antitoxin system prevent-host-death family antitoxin [Methylobacterium sp. NEAU 140]|uniref:type II toxin-antitoxin system prevent-host-death family antitoxin n=1 Tax=Methylobacterium sp. NEAU 140 TaxID=3064945 RepID=UPI00273366A2|nr:type II toxin-antitoxin system prevent-host-death family antitoxin [Methylobacterium sp. NEAU 140]MDP4024219.1 type II toxin-antitoxin system prevent-host-death family antitoxin [Methylobacterium sp. NEAU 140]